MVANRDSIGSPPAIIVGRPPSKTSSEPPPHHQPHQPLPGASPRTSSHHGTPPATAGQKQEGAVTTVRSPDLGTAAHRLTGTATLAAVPPAQRWQNHHRSLQSQSGSAALAAVNVPPVGLQHHHRLFPAAQRMTERMAPALVEGRRTEKPVAGKAAGAPGGSSDRREATEGRGKR